MKMLRVFKCGVLLFVLVFWTFGCGTGKKTITDNTIKEKKENVRKKGDDIQNFNYLFAEALKQKIRGNFELAVKYFTACNRMFPDDDAVNYELSQIWAMAGDLNKAKKYGRNAINLDNENIWYYYQLANIYEAGRNNDTVTVIYKKMVDLFPQNDRLKYSLARLYKRDGKYKEALDIYKGLLRKYGYTKELGLEMEGLYEENGQYEKALEECKKLTVLFPDDIEIKGIKAELYSKQGDFERADKLYEKLLSERERDRRIVMSLIEHNIRKNADDKVEILIRELLERGDIKDEEKFGYAMKLLKGLEKNEKVKQAVIKPAITWIMYNDVGFQIKAAMADYLINQKDSRNAIPLLRQITIKKPEILAAWQQLGIMEEQDGTMDSLLIEMEKGLSFHPDDPLLHLIYGSGLIRKNRNKEAIETLEKGLKEVEKRKENNSLLVQYYAILGDSWNAVGEYEKSEKYYEKALKLDPENLIVLNNYSYYLSLRKTKLDDALRMSKKTIKAEPDNPTYLDTYGWILYNMGRIKEAEKYIGKAIEKDTESSAEVLEHYGDIMFRLNRKEEALSFWKKAMEKDPERKKEIEKKIEGQR